MTFRQIDLRGGRVDVLARSLTELAQSPREVVVAVDEGHALQQSPRSLETRTARHNQLLDVVLRGARVTPPI
ncbi:hypothetical protein GCM10017774_93090 [Lentzea cavernae]|uniref:Uncharacterized protein n=1 Tax=Lentzea cavernae TaxID=2020703 RepID=A0ABQ3MX09_9PSEU|nr:hypothetical protein GCM10017774_93090 [Lentzea cavernae]